MVLSGGRGEDRVNVKKLWAGVGLYIRLSSVNEKFLETSFSKAQEIEI